MGRRLPKRLSEVGGRILDRASKLRIDLAAIAAAAGISPSTLYRIMRAGTGATTRPSLRTKRSLARVLRLPMVELFNEAQLEILDDPTPPKQRGPTLLERLVLHQLRRMEAHLRQRAARAAAYALVDMVLSVSNNLERNQLHLLDQSDEELEGRFEHLLIVLFRRLPLAVRRTAAKSAIRAMLKVESMGNQLPSEPSYRAITRTSWSVERIRRNRPPLET